MTRVSFEIDLLSGGGLVEIDEETLARKFDDYGDLLRRQKTLEGALLIEAQGQPPLRVQDELWAAAQNLCFVAVKRLLEDRRGCNMYRYTSSDGHVITIPMGYHVRIIGEHVGPATIEMRTLLPALFECGVRFTNLLERLGGDHGETAKHLQPFADAAREALRQNPMP